MLTKIMGVMFAASILAYVPMFVASPLNFVLAFIFAFLGSVLLFLVERDRVSAIILILLYVISFAVTVALLGSGFGFLF
jgi:hypothetical protein